jgi:DNA topoisomerase I
VAEDLTPLDRAGRQISRSRGGLRPAPVGHNRCVARLKRSDCSEPGIRRRRRGKGFEYLDPCGDRIGAKDLERIRELAIPPAWEDVWICVHANGHLQATGVDAAGRKQYLYHRRWRERRDQQKFDEMIGFAQALPRMRKRVARDLRKPDMSREQVLACAVRMLDQGFFRIGSEDYAERNESYGLATLLKKHVTVNGRTLSFDYPAKSGVRRVQSFVDPEIRRIVADLKARRGGGPELLAYRNSRRWQDVASTEINDYIKETARGDFSAKDFRTWNATMLAAVLVAAEGADATTKTARKRTINDAVKGVAFFLGNTPAVCRASYIDPRVFDRFRSGWTIGGALEDLDDPSEIARPSVRRVVEEAVLDLLTDKRSPALDRIEPVKP